MNTPPVYFPIVITKQVVFRDWNKTVVKTYEVWDVVMASHDTGTYFVTPMGGIYYDEARRVAENEVISYCHKDDDKNEIRFRQRAGDKLPPWAALVRVTV